MPGGSVPAFTDQVYGVVPPVAVIVSLYGTPTTADGGGLKVTDTPAAIVRLVAWVALCPFASVTFTVKLYVPATVGVPLRFPLLVSDTPGGSEPLATDQVNGLTPPDSVSVSR